MKIIKRISDFTVEVEVTQESAFTLVKGRVYGLLRERDPVEFAIDNRAMSSEPLNPVKEVRMPPVLSGNRIPIAIRAGEVANAECDRYLDIIDVIREGDIRPLVNSLFKKHDWSLAGHVLGLAALIPETVDNGLADFVLSAFLEAARNDGALGSRGRMIQRVGACLYTQLEALSQIASDSVIESNDVYLDLRDKARNRAS